MYVIKYVTHFDHTSSTNPHIYVVNRKQVNALIQTDVFINNIICKLVVEH